MQEATNTVPRTRKEIKFTEKNLRNFWNKVNKNGPLPDQTNPYYTGLSQCWVWTAGKNKSGYGIVRIAGKTLLAHRIVWMIVNGDIPHDGSAHGICLMHCCDRRDCINPSHLQLGTNLDNTKDKEGKNRGNHAKGNAHGSRTCPSSRPRGDKNPSRLYPEKRPRGEAHKMAKLTAAQVTEIRALYAAGGVTQRKLSAQFSVGKSVMSGIVRHQSWRHV